MTETDFRTLLMCETSGFPNRGRGDEVTPSGPGLPPGNVRHTDKLAWKQGIGFVEATVFARIGLLFGAFAVVPAPGCVHTEGRGT